MVKRATSLFTLSCKVAKQVARCYCPFYRSLRRVRSTVFRNKTKIKGINSRHHLFFSPKITLQEICNKIFCVFLFWNMNDQTHHQFFVPSFVLCAAKRKCSPSFVTAFFVETFSFFAPVRYF